MTKSAQTTLEKSLWEMFRDGVKPLGAHAVRIESGYTGMGIPDVNCSYKGTDFWCELKIVDGRKIKFELGQPGWLAKRWLAGGLSWVMARKVLGDKDQIFLWPGCDAIAVSQRGLAIKPYLTMTRQSCRGSFEWQTILECMCERVV